MNKRGFVNVVVMNALMIIGILGIIAAIAIPIYTNYRNRPLNEGWGQLPVIFTSVLPPRGTMARRSVPTSSSSSVAERPWG